ncbi:hypothetical protein [Curtobacterium sp. VKM Ac-1393]|nr:hypothetical protein [Curtobacterium sp. VKM Ac-1393]MBF4609280.1 hypothetical protein [Curtobacterium sp. VKM Ac-1393]
MIVDGISDAHRTTWSRLTRLRTATIGLPMQTSRVDDPDRSTDALPAV